MTALTQILLAVVGIIGVWIAAQQMLIAHQKLNHDLFDRRFAIFVAVRNYFATVLNTEGGTYAEGSDFYFATLSAVFLFDAEPSKYIQEIAYRATELRTMREALAKATTEEKRGEYTEYLRRDLAWFAAEYETFTARFQKTLSLKQIEPFAICRISPFANLREIKARTIARFKGR